MRKDSKGRTFALLREQEGKTREFEVDPRIFDTIFRMMEVKCTGEVKLNFHNGELLTSSVSGDERILVDPDTNGGTRRIGIVR